jgi:SAM-dependent methyltransferase
MLDLRVFFPFTVMNLVWRKLSRGEKTILDVGCGKGKPVQIIRKFKNFSAIGVDVFKPYLRKCKRRNVHEDLILCDVRKLPFKDKTFDAVICLEVLEHLNRGEGLEMIPNLERIAKKKVIITTPSSTFEQHTFEGNIYQAHLSFWTPSELGRMGYSVRGLGLPEARIGKGLMKRFLSKVWWLKKLVWIFSGFFVYYFPDSAEEYVCYKRMTVD